MVEEAGFIMSKVVHCCELMVISLNDQKMPLEYGRVDREYSIILNHCSAIQVLTYCPWCGAKLPESLREKYYNTLKKEYGFKHPFDDPSIPEEFKSDEWWKKRGL